MEPAPAGASDAGFGNADLALSPAQFLENIHAVLTPPARQGEFFGLWGLANRLAAIAGPFSYGLANWLSGGDHRLAILTTGAYFLIGLLLLAGIDAERGRRAAVGQAA